VARLVVSGRNPERHFGAAVVAEVHSVSG
jgi:hypothetical protein